MKSSHCGKVDNNNKTIFLHDQVSINKNDTWNEGVMLRSYLHVFTYNFAYDHKIEWGRSSVVSESTLKSEDPGFDPGQVEGQFFCLPESTLVQTCLCLTPLRVHGTHPSLCTH